MNNEEKLRKEKGYKIIEKLVNKFAENIDDYKDKSYNETMTRNNFINYFFSALGWDMNNEKNSKPGREDVIYEDSLKVGKDTKAPDYCFAIAGTKKFFVEAKPPHKNIKKDKDAAFQIRRYAYNGNLPVAILTDFEELAIYCSVKKPKESDKVTTELVNYIKFSQYCDKWDEIWDIFSYDSVYNGSLDDYITENKGKKGTSEVDKDFLKEIEDWRISIARNIMKMNKLDDGSFPYSSEKLTYDVQLILDRIIFLRIAEDRGIEKYKQLLNLVEKDNVYASFIELCKKADTKYNSGIFHFEKETDEDTTFDITTPKLVIENHILKNIFINLYYPNSPYDFQVLPIEMLGQVYEKFLGTVLKVTDKRVTPVEKPEVKKSKGVFYTPQYIVDYIVKNTVGKLIKDKTPNEISNITILDPSCGSGSFLIRAYQYLLNYHLDYYSNLKKPPKDVIFNGLDGKVHLTIQEKKRILNNNIYGVDIDSSAVEVTKLSLLLKVLEDENKTDMTFLPVRVLPNLSNNIKDGNSLISTNILEKGLNEKEVVKINPFNWETEFNKIFANKGFDIIIGNPPYIRIQKLKPGEKSTKYYMENYSSAVGSYDSYILFLEKVLNLINEKGYIGFIVPNRFISRKYGKCLRKIISNTNSLYKLIDFKDNQIFNGPTTYTCLLFLNKNTNNFKYAEMDNFSNKSEIFNIIDNQNEFDDINLCVGTLNSKIYQNDSWQFQVGKHAKLINKLLKMPIKLEDITEKVFQGFATSADKSYILNFVSEKGNLLELYSNETKQSHLFEKDILKKYIKGKEIKRYGFDYKNKYVIFPYELCENDFVLINRKKMEADYPHTWKYLKTIERTLRNRENKKMNKSDSWWAFTYPRNLINYQQKKIMTPNSAFFSSFAYDPNGTYYTTSGVSGGYGLKLKEDINLDEYYLLAILNSSLMDLYNKKIGICLNGKYYLYDGSVIGKYPIVILDKEKQEPYINLAKELIELNKEVNNDSMKNKTPKEKKLLNDQIKYKENLLNHLVCELYDSEDEEELIDDILKCSKYPYNTNYENIN